MSASDGGTSTSAAAAGGAGRAADLQSEVAALRIRGASTRTEQAVKVGGVAGMVVGLALIVFAWFQASAASTSLASQIDYLISGGLLGLGLVAVGGCVYLRAWLARERYWLARIAMENREHHEALVAALEGRAVRETLGTRDPSSNAS